MVMGFGFEVCWCVFSVLTVVCSCCLVGFGVCVFLGVALFIGCF